jgi:hypothetical protein
MSSSSHSPHLDLIEEFRLRRWARENYVPQEVRPRGWHPVILDEMQARDAEPSVAAPPSDLPRPKLRREGSLSLRRGESFVT